MRTIKESTKEEEYIQSTMLKEEGVIQGQETEQAIAKPCRRRNGQLQTMEDILLMASRNYWKTSFFYYDYIECISSIHYPLF